MTDSPRRKSEQRQRQILISVRLTQAELEIVERHARDAGLLVSTYLRERGLAAAPKRDPASTTAARLDLGPRLGPARAFGFTHTEGDTHA